MPPVEIRDEKGPGRRRLEYEELNPTPSTRDQVLPLPRPGRAVWTVRSALVPRLKDGRVVLSRAPRHGLRVCCNPRTGQPSAAVRSIKRWASPGSPRTAALAPSRAKSGRARCARVVQAYLLSTILARGIATSDPTADSCSIQALGATGRPLATPTVGPEGPETAQLSKHSASRRRRHLVKASRESSEPEVRRKAIQGWASPTAAPPAAASASVSCTDELPQRPRQARVGQALMGQARRRR